MAYKCIAISDKWKRAVMCAINALSKPATQLEKKKKTNKYAAYFFRFEI